MPRASRWTVGSHWCQVPQPRTGLVPLPVSSGSVVRPSSVQETGPSSSKRDTPDAPRSRRTSRVLWVPARVSPVHELGVEDLRTSVAPDPSVPSIYSVGGPPLPEGSRSVSGVVVCARVCSRFLSCVFVSSRVPSYAPVSLRMSRTRSCTLSWGQYKVSSACGTMGGTTSKHGYRTRDRDSTETPD